MQNNRKHLILQQLDETLVRFADLKAVNPPKGWIRAIREALGMTGRQFARRLGVSPPRVTALEREEVSGGLSIKSLRQAAEALDCVLVYALVPRSSLAEMVEEKARELATERSGRVGHSMLLEQQQLSAEETRKSWSATVEELTRTLPKSLWDDEHDF
ncbi:MAG: mobile mystery protein A [Thermodesulfobacteriota bacterium]|nr:mobile mystery protein A [Thermodesulfobacteriota bacterium]